MQPCRQNRQQLITKEIYTNEDPMQSWISTLLAEAAEKSANASAARRSAARHSEGAV